MERNEASAAYSNDLRQLPVLSREREDELITLLRDGDISARNRLVEGHLRFAARIALRYRNGSVPMEDLISAANVGLVRATETFDGSRGFRFITYAIWWIKRSIQETLITEGRLIRLPANRVRDLQTIRHKVGERDPDGLCRTDPAELAQTTGISREFVLHAIQDESPVSLHARVGTQGESELIDLIPNQASPSPETETMTSRCAADIRKSLVKLGEREARVLELHYGLNGEEPVSLADIGRKWMLSRERVRQIHERALQKLRHPKVTARLRSWRPRCQ